MPPERGLPCPRPSSGGLCPRGCRRGKPDAVAFRRWDRARPWREQILAGGLVGVFAHPAPVAVAEDVGEEHLGVIPVRHEEHHVGLGILVVVGPHADHHPGVDQGAKRLGQHDRQAALHQVGVIWGAGAGLSASNGMMGLMQSSRSTPCSRAAEACMVLRAPRPHSAGHRFLPGSRARAGQRWPGGPWRSERDRVRAIEHRRLGGIEIGGDELKRWASSRKSLVLPSAW